MNFLRRPIVWTMLTVAAWSGVSLPLPAAENAADLRARFATPLPEFSPVPIWWWSGDRIEKERIQWQLERIAAGGIYNAIILNLAPSGPLYGSAADEPPFLSEAWWELFGYAVQEARRLGVRLWFYDQLGFSGAGLQARLVRDKPDYRGLELRREVQEVTGPVDLELRVPSEGKYLASFLAKPAGQTHAPDAPQWIWDTAAPEGQLTRYFRRAFVLTNLPVRAELRLTADNGYVAFVNGARIGAESVYGEEGWRRAERFDVTSHLRVGSNVLAVAGENLGGPGGVLLELVLTSAAAPEGASRTSRILSDASFCMHAEAGERWTSPDFDDSAWPAAHVLGPPPLPPWGAIQGLGAESSAWLGEPIRDVHRITNAPVKNTLRVAVPAGRHRAQLYYTVPGGFDYHNPEAGAALLKVVHGEMERRFKAELGRTIAGSFQDEFPALPRFSKKLQEVFPGQAGAELIDRLPALYDDVVDRFGDASGLTTAQIRCLASRLAAQLCERAFLIPLHLWHEKYGLLCGYDQTVRNADPVGGEQYYVDYFKTLRHFSVPGNDQSGDAKPHQSIADLYERPRVWMEGFHSSGWGQTPEEILTLLHPWMADGSTLYNPHAIYYSIHGSFYEWAPPDTGWRQPYFVHYRLLADYVSRLCYLLTRGRHVAEVAVLHPANTVHAYAGFGSAAPAAQRAGELYWAAQRALRKERLDYLILDEDSIYRARIEGAALVVGQARLRMVVLPAARVLSGATIERLNQWADAGGRVVVLGEAPDQAADRALSRPLFTTRLDTLKARVTRIEDAGQLPALVTARLGRDLAPPLPYLHRKTGDRDFYFVLSDDGTPANWNAQFDLNKRRLWETPAARGARLALELAADGIPERWDALTGQVLPIHNFRRRGGNTHVEVELNSTPAPVVSIRPAAPGEPRAIESDLQVLEWRRAADGTEVVVRGLPRGLAPNPPAKEHRARVEFADAVFEGAQPARAARRIALEAPFDIRLEPTCDNRDGCFQWPPTSGTIPVEIRGVRFRDERPGEDNATRKDQHHDDTSWEMVLATYGPRAQWEGPLSVPPGERFETMNPSAGSSAKVHLAEYSLRLGINEDPIYASALGGKGRVPEEFIDLGEAKAGSVYRVRAFVTLPAEALDGAETLSATLRLGGAARKRAFLNGEEVQFAGDSAARVLRAPVKLRPGLNRLDLLVSRVKDGRLRLFYHFLPVAGTPVDPQWIWSPQASATGKTRFARTVQVPDQVKSAAMVVALGDLHQIRVNGKLVADQGNFDPYFTSRAERYDFAKFLTNGSNAIEIEARDRAAVGLLLDGLIELKDGREIEFVSDASWDCSAAGVTNAPSAPARILPGPSQGYMGETAALLLRPRPHPLPLAGWLLSPQGRVTTPAPFDRLVYSATDQEPTAGWYRFRVPPGATAVTLQIAGQAELFVDGVRVPLTERAGGLRAVLPSADAPQRIAALRIQSQRGFERGAALLAPLSFELGPGRLPLGSWDRLGLPHYSGGVRYSKRVELPAEPSAKLLLDLGRVRGTAEVIVNGTSCGTRLWHPYLFDITTAAQAGVNEIEIRVFNTLGPHFGVGHPSGHVFEGHTQSGLFGPVTAIVTKEVELVLRRTSSP